MAKYKVGDKVVKNGDDSHPTAVKHGTEGVITHVNSEFCWVEYDHPLHGKGCLGVGWSCIPDLEFTKKSDPAVIRVKFGNRHTERFIRVAEEHFDSFFALNDDIIPFAMYDALEDRNKNMEVCYQEKEIVIALLCLIDDETLDAWLKEFK